MASDHLVFVASRKFFLSSVSIVFGVAISFLLVDLLWLGRKSPVFHIATLVIFVLCVVVAATVSGPLVSPPRLQIDRQGITVSKKAIKVHFAWSRIAEVRVVETAPADHKGWLVLWQEEGAPKPPDHVYLTEWRPDLNGVRLIDMIYLGVAPDVIGEAVRNYGGGRWNDDRTPR